jgi:hypothetical protein
MYLRHLLGQRDDWSQRCGGAATKLGGSSELFIFSFASAR